MFSKAAIVVVLLMGLADAKKPSWNELNGYTFEQYVSDFGYEWVKGTQEWITHKTIFDSELTRVMEHNAAGKSWKEGVNQFTALSANEKKGFFGRSKGKAFNHVPKNLQATKADFPVKPVKELPLTTDWRDAAIVTPVKDQGHCGSCWAFASASVLEAHIAKQTGLLFEFSVQQLAMCTPNPEACGGTGACEGSTAELAFDYIAGSSGLFQEYQQGYDAYMGKDSACVTPSGKPKATITGYGQVAANNYTEIMNAVATLGPIAVNVDATKWSAYESGIYSEGDSIRTDINHVVALVGYGVDEVSGQKYWLVKISWSPSYGEKGYIRVARSDADESLCGTDTRPQDGVECKGGATSVKVCGTSGIIYDGVYPIGGKLL